MIKFFHQHQCSFACCTTIITLSLRDSKSKFLKIRNKTGLTKTGIKWTGHYECPSKALLHLYVNFSYLPSADGQTINLHSRCLRVAIVTMLFVPEPLKYVDWFDLKVTLENRRSNFIGKGFVTNRKFCISTVCTLYLVFFHKIIFSFTVFTNLAKS